MPTSSIQFQFQVTYRLTFNVIRLLTVFTVFSGRGNRNTPTPVKKSAQYQ